MGKHLLACALVVALAALAIPAHSQTITLSYANFPPANTFPCVQMERWKTEVEKRTDGRVRINTYPGSTLLGAKNMLRGVIQGQADIGCLCMAYQPGVFPLTSVAELPLGFQSSRAASLALLDLYQRFEPEEFSQVKVLTMFASAPSNLMTKTPVTSLEELQGMEIRGSGIASRILDKLGATPVSMPMSETPEALQKGVVQGLLSSLEVMKDLNFAAYCPNVTMTKFQVYPFAVIMNKQTWSSLPSEVKEVMNSLTREQARWTGEYMDAHVQRALDYARSEHGVTVHSLSESDQAEARRRIQPLIEDWKQEAEAEGLPAEQILEAFRNFKTSHE
jgi:TRAP-type C4-dicarboxylate transport system substrate-binding protein